MTEGFLAPVVHLLLSSDMDTQKSASLALSNLALHGPGTPTESIFTLHLIRAKSKILG